MQLSHSHSRSHSTSSQELTSDFTQSQLCFGMAIIAQMPVYLSVKAIYALAH